MSVPSSPARRCRGRLRHCRARREPGCCSKRHSVTLYEKDGETRRPLQYGRCPRRRRQSPRRRYRVHRLQRLQLPQSGRAVPASWRRDARERHVLRGLARRRRGWNIPAPTSRDCSRSRANLLRPRFWAMLRDIVRFYREAPGPRRRRRLRRVSASAAISSESGYSEAFIDDHLLPMGAAIWSTTVAGHARSPGRQLHPLLREPRAAAPRRPAAMAHRHRRQPRLCRAPGRAARRAHPPRLPGPRRAAPAGRRHWSRSGGGRIARYDHVVLAAHADEALALIADASAEERRLLGRVPLCAQPRRAAYRCDADAAAAARLGELELYRPPRERRAALCVTYWMNRLQGLATRRDFFVTLNPVRAPRPRRRDRPLHLRASRLRCRRRSRRRRGCGACKACAGPGFAAPISAPASTRTRCSRGSPSPRRWAACAGRGTVADESGRIALRRRAPGRGRRMTGSALYFGTRGASPPAAARGTRSAIACSRCCSISTNCPRWRGGCDFSRTTASISSASTTATTATAGDGALRPYRRGGSSPAPASRSTAAPSACSCFPRMLGLCVQSAQHLFLPSPRRQPARDPLRGAQHFRRAARLSHPGARPGTSDIVRQSCAKEFYVSPFMAMECRYAFRLAAPGERLAVTIRAERPRRADPACEPRRTARRA